MNVIVGSFIGSGAPKIYHRLANGNYKKIPTSKLLSGMNMTFIVVASNFELFYSLFL